MRLRFSSGLALKSVHLFYALQLTLFCACSVEVENPGKPDKPKNPDTAQKGEAQPTAGDNAPTSSPRGSVGKINSLKSTAASNIPIPTIRCEVNITRGADTYSGREGATLELPEPAVKDGNALVYRDVANNRFVIVTEQLFASAPFSSGDYPFEYYSSNGQSCVVNVTVFEDDIVRKLKLQVEPVFPQ